MSAKLDVSRVMKSESAQFILKCSVIKERRQKKRETEIDKVHARRELQISCTPLSSSIRLHFYENYTVTYTT
jgi:hypothetical protein